MVRVMGHALEVKFWRYFSWFREFTNMLWEKIIIIACFTTAHYYLQKIHVDGHTLKCICYKSNLSATI